MTARRSFVDPPRSGLDEEPLRWCRLYPAILYISCNPQTLCDNLRITGANPRRPTRLALFDQFPSTHHMECGVLLTRKSGKN
ncbi:hypothetical protein WDV93_15910 [Pantoea ananatis]